MPSSTPLLFALGGILLIGGAELLIRGASRLALTVGISPLVVGLTVVAFGTSAPELAVTVTSSYTGQSDVALGNIVGSNIFNVLFILGIAALITPLVVAQRLVRFDVPLMIGASLLVLLLALDGRIARLDGIILFTGIVAYLSFLMWECRREKAAVQEQYDEAFGVKKRKPSSTLMNVIFMVAGLGLLVLGSQWLVEAAVVTATALGMSELVIGLTIVAAGTSLPEVATSVLAALRGERDIAVGNAVGSNLFNLLAVLGLGSIVAPAGIPVSPGVLTFDLPIMIAVAVAALPIFFTGYTIARWEGAVFLGYFAAYIAYLVLDATDHAVVPVFAAAMRWFVLPLTALTLLVIVIRVVNARRKAAP